MSDTDPKVEVKPEPARVFLEEAKPVEPAKPVMSTLVGNKPDVNPAMTPEPGPAIGPTVHGEAAQRFVNKTAIHSERVLQGNVVTPPKRRERYEHPERKA